MATQLEISSSKVDLKTDLFVEAGRSIESALNKIFPSNSDESKLQKSRRILGDIAFSIDDSDLEKYITEFQTTIDYLLDSYEKEVFKGKTLSEVLREGL